MFLAGPRTAPHTIHFDIMLINQIQNQHTRLPREKDHDFTKHVHLLCSEFSRICFLAGMLVSEPDASMVSELDLFLIRLEI